jgi:protocatechuate 3,4-dioxygenase beta subunit
MKCLIQPHLLTLPLVLFFIWNSTYQNHGDRSREKNCIDLRPGQKGFIQLVNNEEPGEPLIIYGRVFDRKTNQPISAATIFLYQTDSTGIYSSSGKDEEARIRGTIYTNESGCFKIKTILPGDYPGQKNSRHLHYAINAKGHPEKKSILFFKGFTTENISGQGPLIVLDIHKDSTGTWIGSTDFYIE